MSISLKRTSATAADHPSEVPPAHRPPTPAPAPMTSAPIGPTKPAAGVIATRPATAPETLPRSEGLPLAIHSTKVQASAATAVANNVLKKASAAVPVASRFEPTLKPNQPTHSIQAPIMVMVSECGGIGVLG